MFTRSPRRSFIAAVSVVVLFAGLLAAGAPASGIEGGDEDVVQLPWVAQLNTSDARGATNLCTGSFLSEKWIVTARHCVSGNAPLSTSVSVMHNGVLQLIGTATEYVTHPDFDVALIRVRSLSFPIASFAKLGNWIQNGSASAYGYGLTGPGGSTPAAETLKSARVEISGFERMWFSSAVSILAGHNVDAPWSQKLQVHGLNGIPRGGDSGGPLVQDGAVVGILGNGSAARDVRFASAQYASTTQVIDWISERTGIAVTGLDAATTRSSYSSSLSSAAGVNLSINGTHLVLNDKGAASPLQIDFDATWAFRLRSGNSCVATADVVNEMTMLVVVRQILQMKPCDRSDFTQKFFLAAQPPTADGKPRGVIRTVVGEQAVSLLGTGEVGLRGTNDEPVLFSFSPSGTTALSELVPALKAAGDAWANPRSMGKRDAPLMEARYIDASAHSVVLPTPPAGVAILDTAVTSSSGGTAAILLGDDGRVYRSERPADAASFSPWSKLPGDGVTVISRMNASGSLSYVAGTIVMVLDAGGVVKNFELPSGVGAVDVAVGASNAGDQFFVLGTDSRVYRYATDRAAPPTQLPGQGIFLLAASDAATGAVAYASAREVYLERMDGSAGFRDLPEGVNPTMLSLSAEGGGDVATVESTDGAVRQLSSPAEGNTALDIGVSVLVSGNRGLTDAQAVPASRGQLLWTDGASITSVGWRCAPPSLLPSGEVVDALATATSATAIIDHAVAGSGAVYVSRNCQPWQRLSGVGGRTPAFTSDGGVLVLRALENRSGSGTGTGGAIGTCRATD